MGSTSHGAFGARAGRKRDHFDVLIVGAGISGIAAGVELRRQSPWATFVMLDALESFGGTWLSNTYPGARCDSDMFTYSYSFKPWEGKPIAPREQIANYLGEVIEEYDLSGHIRYNHKILSANWSADDNCWEIIARIDGGGTAAFTANFLMMCQGYYRHREGHMPQWNNMDQFEGRVVHAQRWPDDFDCTGKRVVVIGSGATAATVLPALADQAAHVVQLQRSPSYYIPRPNDEPLVTQLRQLDIPREWIHEIIRQQMLKDGNELVQHCLDEPDAAKQELLEGVREALAGSLPEDFIPHYKPWHQRACIVPDGDFFEAIRNGTGSVVTGDIVEFTRSGIKLGSGEEIAADIVVAATGFNVNAFGDIEFSKNGKPVDMRRTVTWRGVMFTETPNFSWTIGYFRSGSFTVRSEFVAALVSRMINYMKDNNYAFVMPRLSGADAKGMELRPFWDEPDFQPGYAVRSADVLPQRGDRQPWRHSQDHRADAALLKGLDFEREALDFGRSAPAEMLPAGA